MAKKRFGVGLIAAIFKFKMAAARGHFLSGTHPEINLHTINYICPKFGAFIPICTILFIFELYPIGNTIEYCH
jgi:hypothetical protein